MKLQGYIELLLFMFTLNALSQEISENTFGNDILNTTAKDNSYSMKFAARYQSL